MPRNRPLAPDDPRHGTINGYTNYGCRLPCCRAAWAAKPKTQEQKDDHARRRREKYVPTPRAERYLDAMNFVGRWEVLNDYVFRVNEWADPTYDQVVYNMGLHLGDLLFDVEID